MNKLLVVLVIVMLFVAGGTSYYAYSLYSGGNDKKVEVVEADNEEVEIKEQIIEKPIKESVSAAEKDLSTSITINLDDKIQISPETHDVYSEEISLPLTIINHTDKDIKGFLTDTIYRDMFGEIIYELELKYEYDIIPANDSIQWVGAFDVNRFNENDMRFYTVPFENINFEYKINSIYFTDGTSIEL